MAGDWIKMRIDLLTHPKVVRILSATKSDKFRTIGGLHAVWSVFDTHSVDGELHGYTPETLDHIIGWEGFSSAMITVGWMCFDGDETLTLPEFVEHNGQSAKRRAEDQKRKKNDRKNPESVRKMSANDSDKMRTREEKRREDINISFETFWKSWPASSRKASKSKCLEVWKRINPDELGLNQIVQHVSAVIGPCEDKFRPAPLVYLNQRRWDGWEGNIEPDYDDQFAGAI